MSMYYVMTKMYPKEALERAIKKARLEVLLYCPSTVRDAVAGSEAMSTFAMKVSQRRATWQLERSRSECLERLDSIEDSLDALNWKEREEALTDIKDLMACLA